MFRSPAARLCRNARPRLFGYFVGQIHAAALAALQIVELRCEVARLMDQPAAGWSVDVELRSGQRASLVKGVARIVLEIKILAFGNLAFRLLFNGYAAIIMSCHRSVLSDEVENLVLFCGGVDDEKAVLILSLDPLVFMRASPLSTSLARNGPA
jgi:hypothetical protein